VEGCGKGWWPGRVLREVLVEYQRDLPDLVGADAHPSKIAKGGAAESFDEADRDKIKGGPAPWLMKFPACSKTVIQSG